MQGRNLSVVGVYPEISSSSSVVVPVAISEERASQDASQNYPGDVSRDWEKAMDARPVQPVVNGLGKLDEGMARDARCAAPVCQVCRHDGQACRHDGQEADRIPCEEIGVSVGGLDLGISKTSACPWVVDGDLCGRETAIWIDGNGEMDVESHAGVTGFFRVDFLTLEDCAETSWAVTTTSVMGCGFAGACGARVDVVVEAELDADGYYLCWDPDIYRADAVEVGRAVGAGSAPGIDHEVCRASSSSRRVGICCKQQQQRQAIRVGVKNSCRRHGGLESLEA